MQHEHAVFKTRSNVLSTYQTRPKAPMPTGCRSEYLSHRISTSIHSRKADARRLPAPRHQTRQRAISSHVDAPRCDFKGRAKDLSPYEFGHGAGWCGAPRWRQRSRMLRGDLGERADFSLIDSAPCWTLLARTGRNEPERPGARNTFVSKERRWRFCVEASSHAISAHTQVGESSASNQQ